METLEDLTEEAKERELYEELGAEGSMGARIDSVEETLEEGQQVARGHQETASSSGLQRLGCWKDTANRAIPTLEGQDPGLDGAYHLRTEAIRKCREAATRRGYTVFAVQAGGWCASSANALQTYKKYGTSTSCQADGEGGPWANEVYQIVPRTGTGTGTTTGRTSVARVCEHQTLIISCPAGHQLNIVSALYGRLSQRICPTYPTSTMITRCRSPNGLTQVRTLCQGKSSCSVRASDSVFGDPCPGSSKYLAVKYACTVAACGWRLAYKIQSYAGDSFSLWNRDFNTPANLPSELAVSPAIGHYKSREIDGNWASLNIKQVKVSLYTFSPTLQTRDIIFNGAGSTKHSWFSKSRVISSPWTDLKSAPTNYFSISGHRDVAWRINRRFFINRNYGGCPADNGWLVVLDGNSYGCPWEKRTAGTPRILFSKRSTSVNFERDPGNVGIADVMAIFIKTCDG
ncbi:PREDICTED: uncharacterized protein LOC109467125 isoform X2 [Branchiostoma belcheri]|uniref:Uncharacterized protein LOC109467125 isoform X2 n=1 Tax=Branchiostoma belcheri TaxID=7741 RepID=A0A6P4Y851_BRABE|nr:PREDICTED: uncharacterized protein LOC109467125 isoform X2 [Branchiostoma belcheri]